VGNRRIKKKYRRRRWANGQGFEITDPHDNFDEIVDAHYDKFWSPPATSSTPDAKYES